MVCVLRAFAAKPCPQQRHGLTDNLKTVHIENPQITQHASAPQSRDLSRDGAWGWIPLSC